MRLGRVRGFIAGVVLSAAAAGLGCAPAYHAYSGCGIDCQYCPPSPLPWSEYPPCGCHSKPAEQWLGPSGPSQPPVIAEQPDGDDSE